MFCESCYHHLSDTQAAVEAANAWANCCSPSSTKLELASLLIVSRLPVRPPPPASRAERSIWVSSKASKSVAPLLNLGGMSVWTRRRRGGAEGEIDCVNGSI